MKLNLIILTALSLVLTGCASTNGTSLPTTAIVILLVLLLMWLRRKTPPEAPQPDHSWDNENITAAFIAAIPVLTKELNLEVATSKQTEVLELESNRALFGINLGTNHVQVQVPVTYRYAIPLYDEWQLEVQGKVVLVRSPAIQSSLPPAIHTDEMKTHSKRGWARMPPAELLEQLHSEITPTLSQFASDPRHLALVRETCRESVADFVERWLDLEERWKNNGIETVTVQFPDERNLLKKPARLQNFS
ncbi:MAG: hypothetical protein H0X66_20740 [Verrucomicrobia bacterium]|nr:hypothetical protein [Verrucomicrobiota bacterium]